MGKRNKARMAKKALAMDKSKKRKREDEKNDDEDTDMNSNKPEHSINPNHSAAAHESLKKSKKSKKDRKQDQDMNLAAEIQQKQNDIISSLPNPPSAKEIASIYPPMPVHTEYSATPIDSSTAPEKLKLLRKSLGVRVSGPCPPPITAANVDTSLPPQFKAHLARKNFAAPTPIQSQLWPPLNSGVNCIGIASTGSGKTLSYGLPMVYLIDRYLRDSLTMHGIVTNKQRKKIKSGELTYKGIFGQNFDLKNYWGADGPLGLVVVPTRELANQVEREIKSVCRGMGYDQSTTDASASASDQHLLQIRTMSVIGGGSSEDRKNQVEALGKSEKPTHIIVCTPGRLLDLLASRVITLRQCISIAFDEGDRMLKLGFEEQVTAISKQVRSDARRVLVSATFGGGVREKGEEWIPEPKCVVKVGVIDVAGLAERGQEDEKKKKPKAESGKQKVIKEMEMEIEEAESSSVSKPFSLLVGKAKTTGEDGGRNTLNGANVDEDETNTEPLATSLKASTPPTPPTPPTTTKRTLGLAKIPSHVAQVVHVCAAHKKPKKLIGILRKLAAAEEKSGRSRNPGQTIIFFNQIKTLKYVEQLLAKDGIATTSLHGQLQQQEREANLKYFMAGKTTTMLATDVAARGIHINRLAYVVNYDFPGSLDQYVHRCGRAGRGKEGSNSEKKKISSAVYSFFTRNLKALAPDLLTILRENDEWIDPNLVDLVEGSGLGGAEKSGKKKNKNKNKEKENEKEKEKEKNETLDEKTGGNIAQAHDEGNDNNRFDDNGDNDDNDDDDNDDDDEFKFLGKPKSVLERAENVSSASDSDDDDDDGEQGGNN